MYYFAYGSCMNESDFRQTVVNYRRLGKAVLKDYRVGFTKWGTTRNGGVADLVQSSGDYVEGIVYEIDEQGRDALDIREGKGTHYSQAHVDVLFGDVMLQEVLTYVVINPDFREFAPSAAYAKLIVGNEETELSAEYIQVLGAHIKFLQERDA